MRNLAIVVTVLLLAACGGDEHQDLKAELKNITKDLRGRIDPLPVVDIGLSPSEQAGDDEQNPFMQEPSKPPKQKGDINRLLKSLGVSWNANSRSCPPAVPSA